MTDFERHLSQGTDETLLRKLHQMHAANANYLKPKADVQKMFGINHFAGVVFYHPHGFLEKNRDTFNTDLIGLVQSSKNQFLRHLFAKDFTMVRRAG